MARGRAEGQAAGDTECVVLESCLCEVHIGAGGGVE